MSRRSQHSVDSPVIVSIADTSRSTIKMLVELWYALWHEAHH
jgi:hypothetical protein